LADKDAEMADITKFWLIKEQPWLIYWDFRW